MGTIGPKRLDGDGVSPFDLLLGKIGAAIDDAVITGSTSDLYLQVLLDLTIRSIRENRPIYTSLMDEPILYRYFRQFAEEALGNLKSVQAVTGGG